MRPILMSERSQSGDAHSVVANIVSVMSHHQNNGYMYHMAIEDFEKLFVPSNWRHLNGSTELGDSVHTKDLLVQPRTEYLLLPSAT